MSDPYLDIHACLMTEREIAAFVLAKREGLRDRDEHTIPAELDRFMIAYPTDACPHFSTYTQEVGGMIFGSVPADDDIRDVQVCHDCRAWLEDR